MADDPYVPTPEEAVQIAVDVESGHTRSYVWAAMMLGRFVRHHAIAVSSPPNDGESNEAR